MIFLGVGPCLVFSLAATQYRNKPIESIYCLLNFRKTSISLLYSARTNICVWTPLHPHKSEKVHLAKNLFVPIYLLQNIGRTGSLGLWSKAFKHFERNLCVYMCVCACDFHSKSLIKVKTLTFRPYNGIKDNIRWTRETTHFPCPFQYQTVCISISRLLLTNDYGCNAPRVQGNRKTRLTPDN
jgi:hypothetical protein